MIYTHSVCIHTHTLTFMPLIGENKRPEAGHQNVASHHLSGGTRVKPVLTSVLVSILQAFTVNKYFFF